MKIYKAYKTELNPNNKQRTMFMQCAGAARYVFNWGLADNQMRYEKGLKTSIYEQKRRFNRLKHEQCPWITELPYKLIDAAFDDLKAALDSFFRRVKNGDTPGYPKFKSRKKGIGSFRLRKSIRVKSRRIRLPKIGWVRLKEHGYIPSDKDVKILSATISEKAGRWYVSVAVEEEIPNPVNDSDKVIGIDLGIKQLAICSDGTVFENPKALYKAERKLNRLQRELSRRKRGGQNWKKTKRKLQRQYARIANIRKHALHQISHYVTAKTKPRAIVIEDLNVNGMLQNHSLARAVSDVGMYELRRQIEYKAEWHGIEVIVADRWYPSSKTCSECGSVKPLLKLSDRLFVCEECGLIIDRDYNAALNLAALAKAETQPGCPGS